MLLETLETIAIVVPVLIVILIMFLSARKKHKKRKLLKENYFADLYFKDREDIRQTEYIPCRNKPLNVRKEPIFLANSFCIFVDGLDIRKIDYKDIYWVYGETYEPKKKKGKLMMDLGEILVLKTLYGTHRVYVKNQNPYVKYFYEMNILAGYSDKAIALSRDAKKRTKEKNKKA